MFLAQEAKIVEMLKPQHAGALSSMWVDMSNYGHLTAIVEIGQAAVNTTAITVDKAKTAAGGSNSDGITMANWYSVTDVAGTQVAAADLLVKGTAAASITSSATGSGASIYVIEIDAAELGDGYNFVQVELGASNAANFVSIVGILTEPRYAAKAANMPSSMT